MTPVVAGEDPSTPGQCARIALASDEDLGPKKPPVTT